MVEQPGQDRHVGRGQRVPAGPVGVEGLAVAIEHRFLIPLDDQLRAELDVGRAALGHAGEERIVRLVEKLDDFQSQTHRKILYRVCSGIGRWRAAVALRRGSGVDYQVPASKRNRLRWCGRHSVRLQRQLKVIRRRTAGLGLGRQRRAAIGPPWRIATPGLQTAAGSCWRGRQVRPRAGVVRRAKSYSSRIAWNRARDGLGGWPGPLRERLPGPSPTRVESPQRAGHTHLAALGGLCYSPPPNSVIRSRYLLGFSVARHAAFRPQLLAQASVLLLLVVWGWRAQSAGSGWQWPLESRARGGRRHHHAGPADCRCSASCSKTRQAIARAAGRSSADDLNKQIQNEQDPLIRRHIIRTFGFYNTPVSPAPC